MLVQLQCLLYFYFVFEISSYVVLSRYCSSCVVDLCLYSSSARKLLGKPQKNQNIMSNYKDTIKLNFDKVNDVCWYAIHFTNHFQKELTPIKCIESITRKSVYVLF